MNIFKCRPYYKDSSDPHGKPPKSSFLPLLLLAFIALVGYAVFQGQSVTADVTPTHLRLEVGGGHK
jgi:hypothetical protein